MNLHWLDLLSFMLYFILLSVIAYISGRKKKTTANDYFLAGNTLPWYVVGSSYIASNISSEQFMGMIGAALLYGICVAAPEWAAVIAFSFLIWIFIPFLFVGKIDTIPGFLENRFGKKMRFTFAIVTLVGNIVVFMGPVFYGGGLIIEQIFGFNALLGIDANTIQSGESFNYGLMISVVIIAIASGVWAIWGGLKSVAWMDVLTVLIMVVGGLSVTVFGLIYLGKGDGMIAGFSNMIEVNRAQTGWAKDWVAQHLPNFIEGATRGDHYNRLSVIQPINHVAIPWTHWIFSFFYIGLWYTVINQHMIQKVLAAKNMYHARMGIVFASFLKLLLPFIVVVPGLIYFALKPDYLFLDSWTGVSEKANLTYILLIEKLMPVFMKGFILAALFGAIQSTISSVLNSSSAVFTIDIYKEYLRPKASQQAEIRMGKLSGTTILLLGILLAFVLGEVKPNLFVYTQTLYTFIGPPFSAIFLLGMFWKRVNGYDAMKGVIAGFALGGLLKYLELAVFSHTASNLGNFLVPYANQGLLIWAFTMLVVAISALNHPLGNNANLVAELTFSLKNKKMTEYLGTRWYNHVLLWWGITFVILIVLVVLFSMVL